MKDNIECQEIVLQLVFPLLWTRLCRINPHCVTSLWRDNRACWTRVKEQSLLWIPNRERARQKGGGKKCMEAELSVETCPLRFFGNRQCTFETVPIEAGPNPLQLKLLQARCWKAGRGKESEVLWWGICSVLPIVLAGFSARWFVTSSLFKSKSFKEIHHASDLKRQHGEGEDKEYMKKLSVTSCWKLSWLVPE